MKDVKIPWNYYAGGLLLFSVWIGHLILCPFTKVEESFNTQAVHDFLYLGTNFSQYDHVEFPGVVPRTFFGAFSAASLAYPAVFLLSCFSRNKFYGLMLARLSVGFLLFVCFNNFRRSIFRTRPTVDFWLILLTASQFHFNFYATRFLPNTFALALVLQVFAFLFNGKYRQAVWVATFSAAIFRSELILLYCPIFFNSIFIEKTINLRNFALNCFLALATSLAATVPFDSMLWGRWVWPEGQVWLYNVVQNKSSSWGVSPFLWYFYSVLPRLMLTSLPLVFIGLFNAGHKMVRHFTICCLIFVLLYSNLPHKELRFVIYVAPIFNLSAAWACDTLWTIKRARNFRLIARTLIVGHLMVNILLTSFFLYASVNNYPGGQGLMKINKEFDRKLPLKIHIDVFSAQSGISRFLHQHDSWE